jgi:hypothetical protein
MSLAGEPKRCPDAADFVPPTCGCAARKGRSESSKCRPIMLRRRYGVLFGIGQLYFEIRSGNSKHVAICHSTTAASGDHRVRAFTLTALPQQTTSNTTKETNIESKTNVVFVQEHGLKGRRGAR